MANQKKVLNTIRTLLGMESEKEMLAEAVLEDGTKIATDSDEWKEGAMAFVISEDGEKMPLPTGNYKTDSGLNLEIVDGEVMAVNQEEVKEEEVKEEELAKVDLTAYATKENLVEALGTLHTELSEKISSAIKENDSLKKELSKISKLSAEKPVKHTQTKESYDTGNKALDMMLELQN